MRYLFLCAWAEGSDSAGGEATKVNNQNDLYPQFMVGNSHIMGVEVIVNDAYGLSADKQEEIANAYGCAEAFSENYTGYDSTSLIMAIPNDWKCPNLIVTIKV